MTELTLENDKLFLAFDARGAAIARCIYKPLERAIMRECADRATPNHYTNTIVGPIANRIENGSFQIGEERFALDQNEGTTTLHGGAFGLSELEFEVKAKSRERIIFALRLADGHMGFPGPPDFEVIYELEDSGFQLTTHATSPRGNAFNLAPHFYFNLAGTPDINAHLLQIRAERYLPVDGALIPLESPEPVDGTALDFRSLAEIGTRAFDHNLCLDAEGFREILRLQCHDLALRIESDQRGVQIYDGRHINRAHIAIEPQGWPNAVNRPIFPSPFVAAGGIYTAKSRFSFEAIKKETADA